MSALSKAAVQLDQGLSLRTLQAAMVKLAVGAVFTVKAASTVKARFVVKAKLAPMAVLAIGAAPVTKATS